LNDIETLLAIEEIKVLKARYFRYVDTKDWAGFEGLFSPDAVFDISDDVPGCIVTGAARISETASKPLAGVVSVHHGHCPEIEIVTDTQARHLGHGGHAEMAGRAECAAAVLHGGHYLETYERVAGRWYIKTMKLRRLRVDHERRS
jgi:hypothetical protein